MLTPMRIAGTFLVLLVGLGLGFAAGCNTGGEVDDPAGTYVNRLKACGLLTEGELPMTTGEIEPAVACYLDCMSRATCEELTAVTCDGDLDDPSPALLECVETCVEDDDDGPDEFTCPNGVTIPGVWVCDGEDDCGDASDEQGCVEFMCADGSQSIPEAGRCDGFTDCADGSDELDCPNFFACADGNGAIPEAWQCDGGIDCADGSDELDCPGFFACADGTGSIPEEWQCDGDLDCEDGSDEAGCPTYACANGQQVHANARCNLNVECEDGSDEDGCAQLVCPMP
jgi:hypothetical protein